MSNQQLPVPPLQIPFDSLQSKFGGYDRAATRKLLEELAAAYEAVWVECAALRKTEAELRAELAHPKEVGSPVLVDTAGSAAEVVEEARREAQLALKKARRRAEKVARRAEREARAKADKIVSDARREIERELAREAELPAAAGLADPTGSGAEIVDEARREAQLVLKKAQTKAEKIIKDARRDRREVELEIDRLGAMASETRDELSSFLLAAVKWYRDERNGKPPLDTAALEPKPEGTSRDSDTASDVPASLESSLVVPEEPGERSGLERIAALLEAVERRRELEVRHEIEESMDASS